MRVLAAVLPLLLAASTRPTDAFVPPAARGGGNVISRHPASPGVPFATAAQQTSSSSSTTSVASSSSSSSLSDSVSELKRVLEREYVSFFDPMRREYYAPDVSFVDPMTTLSGVDQYQNNVDMLASRTLLGKFLFEDAGIVLHSIEGGELNDDDDDGTVVSDIVTRWTLRLTAKVLPWSPTARFSGVSEYKVAPAPPSSPVGVRIVGQTDYWDSINIVPESGGRFGPVDASRAVGDFLGQLAPGGFEAAAAAPELPYSLLRRGDGYEVRKYPAYSGVKLPYNRRDEGFGSLGAFTKGMNPLAPALMEVESSDTSDKYMTWPLSFAPPGADSSSSALPPAPSDAVEKAGEGQWRTVRVVRVAETVVAVREFNDASMEPVVRKADRELRECLRRDGLVPVGEQVKFAQYDAIFSMGKRRGEVWIDLEEGGHPW
eukprot:CAMPEP_0113552950 /NCGR_PEP_ID=MMETSP0015_2-20120614/15344_1 /TAXON_ID=2838 /ORGANISM="Odontella" /LENGTH=430 /DNA_ID=CAMNT_0000453969 /DNA_START=178 /DNA_END=1470 /DNA_ORIENTATION=- /assembly_acc=CAM_ASM_000160